MALLGLASAGCGRERAERPPVAAPAPAATTTAARGLRLEPFRFESAAGDVVDAELGHLAVPEHRRAPASRTVPLAFVRFRATTATPGPPIVYLAGGPGGSGIDAAGGPRFALFMALRAVGDVIALDQRGTGRSNAIPPCDAPTPWPLDRPTTRAGYTAWLADTARHCAAWWRARGVDLDGYDTVESADDLEALRQALGAPSLRLVGISYGTHLAMAAMRRHGAHLDRVVLASAEGPDEMIKLPGQTQAFLERTFADAERAALRAALQRLDAAPARVDVTDPRTGARAKLAISKLDLQLVVGYMIKNPSSQRTLAMLLPALAQGDFTLLAPPLLEAAQQATVMRGMPEAMDAASGVSAARRARIAAEAPGTLLEDTLNFPGVALAEPLGVTDLGDEFRAPLRSDVPTLLLSGDRDGRTYVDSHRALAAGLTRATHVIVEGAGHDLFMDAPAITERIVAFLAGEPVSAAPIRSIANPPPR